MACIRAAPFAYLPISCSPLKVPRLAPGSPPQLLPALQEIPQLSSIRQPFIVPEGSDAHGTHGVGDAQTLLGTEIPEISGQVPRVEGVPGPDRVHLRRLETRVRQGEVLQVERATFSPALEHHLG